MLIFTAMETAIESQLHKTLPSIFGKYQEYLPEFIYGSIDGSVTTFAVVAGATGASLDSSIVLILGFANLFADGFSMSIGAYLAAKSENDNYQKHREIEYWEIENIPEMERDEVVVTFKELGFEGDLLQKATEKICEDKDRWVDFMMKHELLMIEDDKSPFAIGTATFISFFIIGFIPLSIFVLAYLVEIQQNLFLISALLTSVSFLGIGYLKSYINATHRSRSVLETLMLGVIAALLAYFVGDVLERLLF